MTGSLGKSERRFGGDAGERMRSIKALKALKEPRVLRVHKALQVNQLLL